MSDANYKKGYSDGAKDERERIISLLPDIFATYYAAEKIIDQVTKRIRKGVKN